MVDPFKPLKTLLKPKASLPAQKPLTGPMSGPLTAQDAAAFQAVRSAIEDNFAILFSGARFTSAEEAGDKANEIVSGAAEIADSILGDIAQVRGYDAFKTGFNFVASPLDTVMEFAKKLAGTATPVETVQAVGVQTLGGLYAAVVPYLGCVKGGVDAVRSLYGAADDVRTGFRALEATPIVNIGAPQQALQSVNVLLDRRANDGFTKGTVQAVEAVVNAALIGSGAGGVATSAVSLASKIAVLAVIIRRRGIEFREMKAGKQALLTPKTLSPAVFTVCPLLGCYLLTASDTSAIVLSCFASGRPPPRGWMDQVEANKKFLDPILGKAKSFISDSLWAVEGPKLSTKGRTVDQRPWVERFWIARFGAKNRGYRIIHKGSALKNKVGGAYEKFSAPITAVVKADLQKVVNWAAEKA
ncbi:MAG TPA: hypothetical protein VLX90_14840 [Steroidobacteraceae bacterium]|nr:hypothetical protein [Steroidobacteraceae bacterium]